MPSSSNPHITRIALPSPHPPLRTSRPPNTIFLAPGHDPPQLDPLIQRLQAFERLLLRHAVTPERDGFLKSAHFEPDDGLSRARVCG